MSLISSGTKDGSILYCIAVNEYDPRKKVWEPAFYYVHAKNQALARYEYMMTVPQWKLHLVDIIGIAPTIGFFGNEKNYEWERKLSAA